MERVTKEKTEAAQPATIQEAAELARNSIAAMRERMAKAASAKRGYLSLVPTEQREGERTRLAEEFARRRRLALTGCGVPAVEAEKLCRSGPARLRPRMAGEKGISPGAPRGHVWTAVGLVERFLKKRERKILVLHGTMSVGKTSAASHFIDLAIREMGINLAASLPTTRPAFIKATAVERDARWEKSCVEETLKNHPYIVIDDLGRESPKLATRMAGLVDAIYDAGVYAVITTQLTQKCGPGSIGERLGPDMWDRVIDRGRWNIVDGPNLRELLGDGYQQEIERVGGGDVWERWVRKFRETAGRA